MGVIVSPVNREKISTVMRCEPEPRRGRVNMTGRLSFVALTLVPPFGMVGRSWEITPVQLHASYINFLSK